jgi:hypothetical protein
MLDLARKHEAKPWFGTLVLLILEANDHGEVKASERWLAERFGMRRETFIEHRRRLEDVGEIEFDPGRNQYDGSRIRIARFEELCSILAVAAGAVGGAESAPAASGGAVGGAVGGAESAPADTHPPAETRPENSRTRDERPEGVLHDLEGAYVAIRGGEVVRCQTYMPDPDGSEWFGDDPTDDDRLEYRLWTWAKDQDATRESAGDDEPGFMASRALDALDGVDGARSERAIGDELARTGKPWKRATIRSVMNELRERGLVEQAEDGTWRRTQEEDA